MPFNLAFNGNAKRISLGTGTLRARAFDGVTPSQSDDLGFCRGAQLTINRQRVEVLQGVPRALIVQYAIQEDVNFQFTSLEWQVSRIKDGLGDGIVSGSGSDHTLLFGGSMSFNELALSYVHQLAAGGTVTLDIWKAQGTGELTINYGDEVHEFPTNYKALVQTTSWGNNQLAEKAQLFRLRVTLA